MLLTVIFHCVLMHQGISAYVLCLGSNGHIAVEKAHHRHDLDLYGTGGDVSQSSEVFSDDEGLHNQFIDLGFHSQSPCLDLPIHDQSFGDYQSSVPLIEILLAMTAVLSFFLLLIFLPAYQTSLRFYPLFSQFIPDRTLLARRTVVFLD